MRTEIAYLERLFYRELLKVGKEHCRIVPRGGQDQYRLRLPYFSRRGEDVSGFTTWSVFFIDGVPREHPTKLGEWLTHVNTVRA
jgi:hypothetical protein